MYLIACTPEAKDLNEGCAAMPSNSVKISSQKTFETLKFENFTFLIQLFEMVWATIHKICRKSSAGCLPMIAYFDMVPNYIHFSFLLGALFYIQWLSYKTVATKQFQPKCDSSVKTNREQIKNHKLSSLFAILHIW